MSFNPYLTFDGNCADALNFYAEVFGGEAQITQTVAQSPMAGQFPEEVQEQVMHGQVRIDDRLLMGSDSLMGPYEAPAGFSIQMSFADAARAKRVFDRLARHGEERMPFAATFFSPGFGMCRDRFGVPWMIVADSGD